MSIKVRLSLLLGVLLVAFLIVLQLLRRAELARADELAQQTVADTRQGVERWLSLSNQPLQRFTRDFSQWSELAAFLTRPDPTWAEANLRRNLANYEAHALWLLDASGATVHAEQAFAGPPLPAPVPRDQLAALGANPAGRHFFAESRDGFLEIWTEPISSGHTTGWLVVARLWNQAFITGLSRLAEVSLQLAPTSAPADHAQVVLPLAGVDAQPLRQLQVRLALPDLHAAVEVDTLATRLLLVFVILVILAVWLSLQQWVLHPLDRITASLSTGSLAPLAALQGQKGELARVARLVESSFAQKAALEAEIEERRRTELALRQSEEALRTSLTLRARLARDLHDGVIQSIYAAGLGLESALSQIESDLPAGRTRLQHCRQSLNDVIRQVRGFINGLEPEQMQRQGFASELAALTRTMEALWPVTINLQVDPATARRLSAKQEIHALQIVRECISNALRHGEAKVVAITLAPDGLEGRLTIRDDGKGFDPEARAGTGSGLGNLASRAAEMQGTLRIDSRPEQGAVVVVTFALTGANA